MAHYIEVEEARQMSGLRVVITAGFPGPWGEAVKGMFFVKRIPFVRVRQVPGAPNAALREWTGQTSAPVVIWNDERPRTTWAEQLFLAERLAREPGLIPSVAEDRVLMFGLSNEICGELGFGWCRRLLMIHTLLASDNEGERGAGRILGEKYGYQPATALAAPQRIAEILRLLQVRLESQRAKGSRFFIGDRLSALDIYWATFAALIQPLPDELCPLPDQLRQLYTASDPVVRAAATPLLLEHRDMVYRDYLETPLDL